MIFTTVFYLGEQAPIKVHQEFMPPRVGEAFIWDLEPNPIMGKVSEIGHRMHKVEGQIRQEMHVHVDLEI